jgi:peptidoglycan/LPS O-acetylase OafA/YrhL
LIANIQSLRGVAAMLVVLFHLASIEANYGHGYRLLSDAWTIGMSGVDLFFVISGFVMVTVTRGRFGISAEPLRFLLRRATRIYPLYWLFSLLVLAAFLIGPGLMKRSLQGGGIDLPASFLLLPQDGLPLLMAGWTLIHEMYFYLVFALLLLFPERWLGRLLAGWAMAIAGASVIVLPATADATLRLVTHPLTLEFIAGGFAALCVHRSSPRAAGRCLAAGIVLWPAGYLVHISLGYGLEPSGGLRVLVFGVPAALVVHGLAALESRGGRTLPAWSVRLGDASYSLYLSHVLVMGALARIGTALPQAGDPLWRPVLLAMLVAAATGFGIACHRHIEAPLLRISRRLLR